MFFQIYGISFTESFQKLLLKKANPQLDHSDQNSIFYHTYLLLKEYCNDVEIFLQL